MKTRASKVHQGWPLLVHTGCSQASSWAGDNREAGLLGLHLAYMKVGNRKPSKVHKRLAAGRVCRVLVSSKLGRWGRRKK